MAGRRGLGHDRDDRVGQSLPAPGLTRDDERVAARLVTRGGANVERHRDSAMPAANSAAYRNSSWAVQASAPFSSRPASRPTRRESRSASGAVVSGSSAHASSRPATNSPTGTM